MPVKEEEKTAEDVSKTVENTQKEEETIEKTEEKNQNKTEEKDKFVYKGPNTKETVLFSKSYMLLTSEEEKKYVETLITVRNSLTSVLDQTSKTLKNGSLLNSTSKQTQSTFNKLRESILSLPIPHIAAVRKN